MTTSRVYEIPGKLVRTNLPLNNLSVSVQREIDKHCPAGEDGAVFVKSRTIFFSLFEQIGGFQRPEISYDFAKSSNPLRSPNCTLVGDERIKVGISGSQTCQRRT